MNGHFSACGILPKIQYITYWKLLTVCFENSVLINGCVFLLHHASLKRMSDFHKSYLRQLGLNLLILRQPSLLLQILLLSKPVLVAQGFKWSRCTATLMDVHALGAPLGAWKEGISGSTMSLYPTRGQWLPYRGRDMEKAYFPPSSAHLSGGRGFKPRDRQKLFRHKIQLLAWRDDIHTHADFPI